MSDIVDPLDDLTGGDPDEPMQTGYSPPEREPRHLRRAPTPDEERRGESLDDRLAEEEPDITADGPATVPQRRAGRLVAPDEGAHPDEEKDEVATDVGPAGYAASSEEAAVHIEDDSRR